MGFLQVQNRTADSKKSHITHIKRGTCVVCTVMYVGTLEVGDGFVGQNYDSSIKKMVEA